MLVHDFSSLKQLSAMSIKDFILADGSEQKSVSMPLSDTEIDKIYLGGQTASGKQAALTVATILDGEVVPFETKIVAFDLSDPLYSKSSMVTHVFREKFQLFGLTSTEPARPGEPRQIGLWRMRLTDRGRPRKGGVISQALTAS